MQRIRERAIRMPDGLWQAAARVGDIHADMPDAALPFLIYERGLEEVVPWLPDPRRAIVDGRLWQRIRGTPTSVEMALGWVSAPLVRIEEMSADTWWDLFQLELSQVIHARARLDAIVALTRLSKPAHMDVVRVYNRAGDQRMVYTDASDVGGSDLIGDWSGHWLGGPSPVMPKIAFRTERRSRVASLTAGNAIRVARQSTRSVRAMRSPMAWSTEAWGDGDWADDSGLHTSRTSQRVTRVARQPNFRTELIGAWSTDEWSDADWA
jgi:hypothetical protein